MMNLNDFDIQYIKGVGEKKPGFSTSWAFILLRI